MVAGRTTTKCDYMTDIKGKYFLYFFLYPQLYPQMFSPIKVDDGLKEALILKK